MRHVKAMLLAALLALLLPIGAVALGIPAIDLYRTPDLSVDFQHLGKPVSGVPFDLYRVGDLDEAAQVQLIDSLASKYSVTSLVDQSGWSQMARSMATDLAASGVAPVDTAVTDASGVGVFAPDGGLTTGLYLLVGHDTKIGNKTFTTYPFLLSLPMWDTKTDDWSYVVCVSPKYGEKSEGTTPGGGSKTGTKTGTGTGKSSGSGSGSKSSTATAWERLAQTGDYLLRSGRTLCWA